MSTPLIKMFEENFGKGKRLSTPESVPCALCRGEIYRGEYFYELDGRKVCEACLERYARHCFAHQRRRLSAAEKEDT